jgi:hypothetical protein
MTSGVGQVVRVEEEEVSQIARNVTVQVVKAIQTSDPRRTAAAMTNLAEVRKNRRCSLSRWKIGRPDLGRLRHPVLLPNVLPDSVLGSGRKLPAAPAADPASTCRVAALLWSIPTR